MDKGYMSNCSSCGAACHSEAICCPSCGNPSPTQSHVKKVTAYERTANWGALCIVIFILVSIAFAFILHDARGFDPRGIK